MDLDRFLNKPFKNCIFESTIYDTMKKNSCMMGIDEAGRGPVLGPMVYGCAFYKLMDKTEMKEMEFADSKQLTEEKRDKLFEKINNIPEKIGWICNVLSPNYISNSMLKRSKYNLNTLSHDTAINLIKRALSFGLNLKEVYLDTVGPAEKYEEKLKKIFPDLKIKVSKKADSLYPVVSAASICAKVIRDNCIKNWKFIEKLDIDILNCDYGSGYPGDPKTKEFLIKSMDKIFGFPNFIRFSWSTASRLLDKKAIKCDWQDSDEEDEEKFNQSIKKFFPSKEEEVKKNKFFLHTNIERINYL